MSVRGSSNRRSENLFIVDQRIFPLEDQRIFPRRSEDLLPEYQRRSEDLFIEDHMTRYKRSEDLVIEQQRIISKTITLASRRRPEQLSKKIRGSFHKKKNRGSSHRRSEDLLTKEFSISRLEDLFIEDQRILSLKIGGSSYRRSEDLLAEDRRNFLQKIGESPYRRSEDLLLIEDLWIFSWKIS